MVAGKGVKKISGLPALTTTAESHFVVIDETVKKRAANAIQGQIYYTDAIL